MSDPLERDHYPAIDVQFFHSASVLVSRKKELGREVELEFVVPFEFRIELALKPVVRPESHDFILVLYGEKFEIVERHGMGQSMSRDADRAFDRGNPLDSVRVAPFSGQFGSDFSRF